MNRTDRAPDGARSLRLPDVLAFVRRGLPFALLAAVLAGATSYLITSRADPVYRAGIALVASQPGAGFAGLDVVAPPPVDPGVYRSALLEGSVVSDALTRITGSRPSERALETFVRSLRVSVENQQISSVIRIEVQHRDPVFAAELANTIADELMNWDRERANRTLSRSVTTVQRGIADIDRELAGVVTPERQAVLQALRRDRALELERAIATSSSALVVGLLEPLRAATPPERAVGPRVVFATLVAVLLGLIGAYGVLLVRIALDTGVGDRDAVIALTGLPVLAEFVRRPRRSHRHSPEMASFLRTNLLLATRTSGTTPRVIVVTTATDIREKDRVAVSLAESLARGGTRTLLVDADLRHPNTTRWLNVLPNAAAPFEVHLANPQQRYGPVNVAVGSRRSFDFVPSFTSAPFPVDALNQGLGPLLEAWKSQYDVIVLDTAPVIPFADTLAVAPFATGVVLCASARTTSRDHLLEAIDVVGRAQVRVLGVVLTDLAPTRARRVAAAQEEADERRTIDAYKTGVVAEREASPVRR
jgi:Mrp family chromosome partitioning ATPase